VATWFWLSGLRERDIIKKSVDHVKYIVDTVNYMNEMIKHVSMEEYEKALEYFRKADEAEKKADVVKRSIIEELSRGVIHPLDREHLLRLILVSDDIAAHAKAVVRRLKIIVGMKYRIPVELMEIVKQMSQKIVEAANFVLKAIEMLGTNPRSSLLFASDIEKLEEDVDVLRIEALETLMRYCRAEFGPECIMFKELIDNLEATSDKCEDTGDMIRAIAISLS